MSARSIDSSARWIGLVLAAVALGGCGKDDPAERPLPTVGVPLPSASPPPLEGAPTPAPRPRTVEAAPRPPPDQPAAAAESPTRASNPAPAAPEHGAGGAGPAPSASVPPIAAGQGGAPVQLPTPDTGAANDALKRAAACADKCQSGFRSCLAAQDAALPDIAKCQSVLTSCTQGCS